MPYSTEVEAARALTTKMHKGQTDKAGLPYVTHPRRVASRLDSPEAKVVVWQHDTVEDTRLTLGRIEYKFGHENAAAVNTISRRNGEKWNDYLARAEANPIGRQVKISDLIDNSNLNRIPNVTMRDVKRQEKYNKAQQRLLRE